MSFYAKLLRFLLSIFAPFILIGLGAAVIGLGLSYSIEFVSWTGVALIGAGVLWGFFLFLYVTEG